MYVARGDTPCRLLNADLWMSKENSARTKQAVVLCNTGCLEKDQCLRSTIRFEKRTGTNFGVFGGLTQSEREKLIA